MKAKGRSPPTLVQNEQSGRYKNTKFIYIMKVEKR